LDDRVLRKIFALLFFVERFVDAFFVDRVFVVVAISLY